jgi:hypothetical protein
MTTTSKLAQNSTLNDLQLNTTPCTSTTAGNSKPWSHPELTPNPDYLLDKLRDVTQMKNRMEAEQKDLKAQLAAAYAQGHLAHLVDDKNSQRYNGSGVSVTLVDRASVKVWEPEVQSELDKLQAEIKRVEFVAERKLQYTEQAQSSYWKVTLAKDRS